MNVDPGLRIAEILDGLPAGTLRDFQSLTHPGWYPPGAVLFSAGDACAGVFWASSGQVNVSALDHYAQQVTSHIAEPGEILGLKAALCSEAYGATAWTKEPCEVNFIALNDLSAFLSTHPDAVFRIVERLSDRLHLTIGQFRLISSSHLLKND